MVKNNILLAFRQLLKNKVFSLINILGLSFSMVACLLIYKYVSFERSFDDYHTDIDQVYRLYRHSELSQDPSAVASIFPGIAVSIKANVPEVTHAARFIGSGKIFQSFAFTYFQPNGATNTFNINQGFFADHDAFDVLTLDWVEGDGSASLSNPNEIVISSSVAKKFFGDQPAVGKVLRFKNQGTDMLVTGVFKDLPANTHFKFEVLCSFTSLPSQWNLDNDFGWGNFYTYVKLAEGGEVAEVQRKINEDVIGREPWYTEEGIEFLLQPMADIHLKSNVQFELEANGNERTVNFLTIIGVFIMVIAWVNYINLSTSKLVDRGKEVGIRKVLGSYKRQLIYQFLSESILINFVAIILTLTILQLTLGFFETLLGIPLAFVSGGNLMITMVFIGSFTLGSVLFGFYPALLFSNLKVTQVLKGKSKTSRKGLLLRRGLTVFQFATALVLIIGTAAVYQQLQYMQNKSLGMNIDQTLVVRKPFMDSINRVSSHRAFMGSLESFSSVKSAAASSEIPGQLITRQRWVYLDASEESHGIYAKDIAIDEHFFDLYEIDLLHGRNFVPEDRWNNIILNETGARELFGAEADLESKINQTYIYLGRPTTLIGIIADYNQESLKTTHHAHVYTKNNRIRFYSVKLNGGDIPNALSQINEAFNGSYVNSHFDYFFMDSFFDRQYKSDRLFGRIFAFFSILAIVITALGLFGLSLYNVSQRSKEVSIRKVLGASLQSLSVLLTKEYFFLVLLASVVAIPLGFLMVDQWLSSFPYRMDIGALLFLVPVVLVLVLAGITVAYQVLKTARANPADRLRYE